MRIDIRTERHTESEAITAAERGCATDTKLLLEAGQAELNALGRL